MYRASSNLWQFAGMNIAPIRKEILKGSRELTTQKNSYVPFYITQRIFSPFRAIVTTRTNIKNTSALKTF